MSKVRDETGQPPPTRPEGDPDATGIRIRLTSDDPGPVPDERLRERFLRITFADRWEGVARRAGDELAAVKEPSRAQRGSALYAASVAVDRELWADETGWAEARLARWYDQAARHLREMETKPRHMLIATHVIEAIHLFRAEEPRVDAFVAVLFGTSEKAVRTSNSRAFGPLSCAAQRDKLFSRLEAQRFVMPRLDAACWEAAESFVDAVRVDEGLHEMRGLYATYRALENAVRSSEREVTCAWDRSAAALAEHLLASPRLARDLALHAEVLGVDLRGRSRLSEQEWRAALKRAGLGSARRAAEWGALLGQHAAPRAVREALGAVERCVGALVQHERDAKEAWACLLWASADLEALCLVKNDLRDLIAVL